MDPGRAAHAGPWLLKAHPGGQGSEGREQGHRSSSELVPRPQVNKQCLALTVSRTPTSTAHPGLASEGCFDRTPHSGQLNQPGFISHHGGDYKIKFHQGQFPMREKTPLSPCPHVAFPWQVGAVN